MSTGVAAEDLMDCFWQCEVCSGTFLLYLKEQHSTFCTDGPLQEDSERVVPTYDLTQSDLDDEDVEWNVSTFCYTVCYVGCLLICF